MVLKESKGKKNKSVEVKEGSSSPVLAVLSLVKRKRKKLPGRERLRAGKA